MKKKLLNSMRVLLAAVLLGVGASNAWGVTKTLYSQNFNSESAVPTGWTQASGTLSLEVSGTNKWLRETTAGSGSRGAWYTGTAIKDAIGEYTSYTLEFDCKISEGTNTTNYSQGVWVTGSTLTQSWGAPTGYAIGVKKGSNETNYTIQVNAASTTETVNLTSGTWYHYVCAYDHSTKKITFSILSQDKSSTIYAAKAFDYDYSADGKGVFQSIAFQAGRGSGYTELDNILLTTEVDEEVVSNPSISAPVYAGDNRTITITGGTSSESNAVTTYYTTDGTNPTSSSTEYTGTITITEDCTVKAISISSTDVSSNIVSVDITVGKLTLNAPTLTKTAYTSNQYTVKIDNDQSGLAYVPASVSVYYSIDGGSATAYSAPFSVTEGSTVKAYVTADDYTNSADTELKTGVMPSYPTAFSQNFVGVVAADVTMSYDGSSFSNCIVSNIGDTYVVYSADGTNASTDANIGFYVNNASNPRKWMVRPSGGVYNLTATTVPFGITNVKAGQVIKIEWTTSSYGGITVNSGITMIDNISYGTTGYYTVNISGTVYFNAARNAYVKNIYVYNPPISVTVSDAGMATYVNSDYDLDFSASEIEAYKVKVSTKGVATLTKVDNVPAGTPVLLYKDGGATENIPVMTGAAAVSDNDLVAGTGATVATVDGDYTNMILNNVDSKIGFYYANGQTVATNRAYLHILTTMAPNAVGGARGMSMVFADETTGINSVQGSEVMVNYYNLNGQRVNQPTRGLYIVNGKKVIIK